MKKQKKGFTLIEFLVYVSITAFVFAVMLNFTWSIINSKTRVNVSAELTSTGRIVLERLTRDIKHADDIILASSILDTHPGVLVLSLDGDEVRYETYIKNVTIAGETAPIRKIRRRVNLENDQDITSDALDVTNFVVQDLTRGAEAKNVNLTLTLQHINPGNTTERNKSITLESGATIRQN